MTPAARIQAAIELLDAIEASRAPADELIRHYFRGRRYAGAKDRRAVIDRVFGILRRRARLDWWIARVDMPPTARRRLLVDIVLADEGDPPIADLFAAGGHGPADLDDAERVLLDAMRGQRLDNAAMPEATRLEIPSWLFDEFRRSLGDRLAGECAALNRPAPVDLRVNIARTGIDAAIARLAEDGVSCRPTPISPIGLRVATPLRLQATRAFRDGLIEAQDEGSQIAALAVGAAPGMTVVDLCAGAGGKTLALAAAMARSGRIDGRLIATDADADRLSRLSARLRRARIQGVAVAPLADNDEPLASLRGRVDRVLIDAPCDGSGAWRRHPEARWRLAPADLDLDTARQDRLLRDAADLPPPGGRIIYVTCSLFRRENEDRVDGFLAERNDFVRRPATGALPAAVASLFPPGDDLRLSPATTGTDGFYVAVLERRA